MKLSDKAYKLREKYKEKYNKQPKGWEYDKETMKEYEEYKRREAKALLEVEKYNTSKYCGYTFTTNGFINLYKLMIQAFKKNYQVNNPNLKIFLIAGSADPVIQSKEKFNELKDFLSKIGYSNIKSKLYENMRHEILNEANNKLVYEDVLNFFDN